MPRFSGTPVEDTPQRKPRFSGTPMPEGGPTQENADIVAGGPTRENAAVSTHNPQYLRDQYNQLPWYGKIGQALDDTARYGTDTLTFGGADKLASKLPGGGTLDEERQKTADARARSTGASTATDVLSYMSMPKLLERALPGLLGMATDAGLYSGAQTYGHGGSAADSAKNALTTGGTALVAGGALPAARTVSKGIAATTPSISQLLSKPKTIEDAFEYFQNMGKWSPHASLSYMHPLAGPLSAGAHIAGGKLAALADRALSSSGGQAAQDVARITAGSVAPAMPWFDYYKGAQ